MVAGVGAGQGTSYLTATDQCSVNRQYGIQQESPIILNLDSGDLTLTGPSVLFDITGTSTPHLLGWTRPESEDGFLVLDRDGDGVISSGREMFGNFTPLSWDLNGSCAEHGFEALAWFDALEQRGNADGWITTADAVFPDLKVWIDRSHDGISQAEELKTLAALGIVAISVDAKESSKTDSYGNHFRYRAKVLQLNGQSTLTNRFAYDVFLVRLEGGVQ